MKKRDKREQAKIQKITLQRAQYVKARKKKIEANKVQKRDQELAQRKAAEA